MIFDFANMTTLQIIGQFVGILGVIDSIIIYQQKTRKGLLISKLIGDVLWGASYFMLGSIGGGAVCVIAIFRELVFINRGKHKWADGIGWLFVFIALALSSIIYSWETDGAWCIATAVASAISVYGFWNGSPKLSRILRFPISTCMLTYDIVFGALMAILNEALSLVSTVIGIVRHDIKGKEPEGASSEDGNS